jgi:hypothetical protein
MTTARYSTTRRHRQLALLVVVGALVLAGCDVRWAARVNVAPDGSVTPAAASAVAFSADGTKAAFSSSDIEYIRDVANGATSIVPNSSFPFAVKSAALDADGSVLVIEYEYLTSGLHLIFVDRVDMTTGVAKTVLNIDAAAGVGGPVDINDGGRRLSYAGPGAAAIYDNFTNTTTFYPLPGTNGVRPEQLTVDRNGLAFSYVTAGTLRTYNWFTGVATQHSAAVPGGATLVGGQVSDDLSAVVAEDSTGTLYHSGFGAGGSPVAVSFAPDDTPLAVDDYDISDDGEVVAFTSGGALYVRDVSENVTRQVTPADTGSTLVGLSADGSLVSFSSTAPGLVPGDDDTKRDVFVLATFGIDVQSVAPTPVAPGTETTLTLTGSGFTLETTARATGQGITSGATTFVSESELLLAVTVSPDAAAGTRNVIAERPGPGVDSAGRTSSFSNCLGCLTIE